MPPALNIPEPIADLRAVQRGDQLDISFTVPALTTEGLAVKDLKSIDLRIGAAPPPFDLDRWMAASQPVAAEGIAGPIRTQAPARDWYGREVVVGVRLENARGRFSDWSNLAVLSVIQPLPAPSEVRATPNAKGIAVSWKSPPREKMSFRILRRPEDEKQSTIVATVNGTEYIDSAITQGKRYEYSVQSVLGTSESELAPPVSAVATDVFAPAAPAGLTAVASLNSIELGWERSAEPDLAHYRVYRAEGEAALMMLADKVENPAYSDRQVTAGKTYRYTVSAVDAAGNEGEKSAPVQTVAP
jgi:hypothetical protein